MSSQAVQFTMDEEQHLHYQHRKIDDQNIRQMRQVYASRSPADIGSEPSEAKFETAYIATSSFLGSRTSPRTSPRHRGGTASGKNIWASLIAGVSFIYMMSLFRAVFQLAEPNKLPDGSRGWHVPDAEDLAWLTRPTYMASLPKPPELRYIHERPKIYHPPVYLAIPTVPRAGNPNYLLKVLESLKWSGFPLHHVNVFYNGRPEKEQHLLWEQAEMVYSSKGVNFMWNEAPVPEGHPSLANSSVPYPAFVDVNEEQMVAALSDSISRREWRRKECFDFRLISQYMLQQVYDGVNVHDPDDVARRNASWVIFNQDDAEWKKEFYHVLQLLQSDGPMARNGRYDLNHLGLVSVAFRADILSQITDYAERWCDFKPVDWVVWQFFGEMELGVGKAPEGFVKHIGAVSTRLGRVEDPAVPGQEPEPKEAKKNRKRNHIPRNEIRRPQNELLPDEKASKEILVDNRSSAKELMHDTTLPKETIPDTVPQKEIVPDTPPQKEIVPDTPPQKENNIILLIPDTTPTADASEVEAVAPTPKEGEDSW
jgi:hypothetical protein